MRAQSEFLKMFDGMSNILISCFTFDDIAHPLYNHLPIKEVLIRKHKPQLHAQGTNYASALQKILELIENCPKGEAEYMTCILFFSDGGSEYPSAEMEKLIKMKQDGKVIIVVTIAMETEDDGTLRKIARTLQGNHYSASNVVALPAIFQEIFTLS